MDREKKDELPMMQVNFIDSICLPLYKVQYSTCTTSCDAKCERGKKRYANPSLFSGPERDLPVAEAAVRRLQREQGDLEEDGRAGGNGPHVDKLDVIARCHLESWWAALSRPETFPSIPPARRNNALLLGMIISRKFVNDRGTLLVDRYQDRA